MLYFSDENHWVLKPANSLVWYREVRSWLDRYAGGTADDAATAGAAGAATGVAGGTASSGGR
jgi:hypothetical protein